MAFTEGKRLQHGRNLGLVDRILALPPIAAQLVVKAWQRQMVPRVRLVCQALRAFVDEHVGDVKVDIVTANPEISTPAFASRLARFASPTSVRLSIEGPGGGDRGLADYAGLPFHALPPEKRSQIQELTIVNRMEGNPPRDGEAAVARLASLLPNLRKMDARHLGRMTYDQAQQQQMFNALARLPHLEDLELPDSRALSCVGSLAHNTRLRRLTTFVEIAHHAAAVLSHQALAGMSQLQHLNELIMRGTLSVPGGGAGGLRHLLDHLPASLQHLDVQARRPDELALRVDIRLVEGQLSNVQMHDEYAYWETTPQLSHLADAARQLLACRQMPALPARVPLLVIHAVRLGEPQEAFVVDSPEVQLLWAFLQRCERVQVSHLGTTRRPLAANIEALARLGKPEQLHLEWMHPGASLGLRKEEESTAWAAGAVGQEPGQPGSAVAAGPSGAYMAAPLPTRAQAVERVVGWLTQPADVGGAAVVAVAAEEAGGSWARDTAVPGPGIPSGAFAAAAGAAAAAVASPAEAASDSDESSSDSGDFFPPWEQEELASRMLLLRGAAVGEMARTPDVLHQWVSSLDGQAAASLGMGEPQQGQQQEQQQQQEQDFFEEDLLEEVKCRRLDGGRIVSYYQLLPAPASLLFVKCRSGAGRAGAAAVAAVASAAAEGQQAGALEVSRVATRAVRAARTLVDSKSELFEAAAVKVLQGFWDQHAARLRAGGLPPPGGELALVRRLLELAEALTPVAWG